MTSAEPSGRGAIRLIVLNGVVLLGYWGVSYLNWLIFSGVGVLPMPIWPAAAIALVSALLYGWRIAPGIALGTILANHWPLGASWPYAACIAVMNTAGPVLGAAIIRLRIRNKFWTSWTPGNVTILFLAGIILVPAMTASGGIGSKWLLDLVATADVPKALLGWWLAHALGTLLFAPPLLLLLVKGDRR